MEQRVIMKRIDQILSHPVFREQFALLQEAEKDRIFCRHTMEHFLDVARLMYIYNLEDQAGFSKEMLYAAGLLHDIGKLLYCFKVKLTINFFAHISFSLLVALLDTDSSVMSAKAQRV